MFLRKIAVALALFYSVFSSQLSSAQTIRLTVDLTDAPRNIYHAVLNIPVKPGPFTQGTRLLVVGIASTLVFLAGYFVFDRLRDTLAEEV